MKSIGVAFKHIFWDVVMCGFIIIPLFTNNGIYCFLSKMGVAFSFVLCVMGWLGVIGCLMIRQKGKSVHKYDVIKKYDNIFYRLYEPFSDLVIAVCLGVIGHYILGAFWLVDGIIRREIVYVEIEEYKQGKRKRYASKSN